MSFRVTAAAALGGREVAVARDENEGEGSAGARPAGLEQAGFHLLGSQWQGAWIPTPAREQGCIRRGYCCRSNPGWFAPGQVARAARHAGQDVAEFAARYLIVDQVELPSGPRVEVFAPLKLDRFSQPAMPPLTRVDALYRMLPGPCIFYDADEGCRIHPQRPAECAAYFCSQPEDQHLSYEAIGAMWLAAQGDDVASERQVLARADELRPYSFTLPWEQGE